MTKIRRHSAFNGDHWETFEYVRPEDHAQAIADAVKAERERWETAWYDMRNSILNGPDQLAAMEMGSDRINAVLGIIDAAYAAVTVQTVQEEVK